MSWCGNASRANGCCTAIFGIAACPWPDTEGVQRRRHSTMLLPPLRGIALAWRTHMATALLPDERGPLREGEDSMAKRNDKMGQPEDAIAMLKADHQRVRDLFQEYEAAQDQQAKRDIAEEAFVELEMHAQLEEQIFYPAVEDEIDEQGQELVEESLEDHQT